MRPRRARRRAKMAFLDICFFNRRNDARQYEMTRNCGFAVYSTDNQGYDDQATIHLPSAG